MLEILPRPLSEILDAGRRDEIARHIGSFSTQRQAESVPPGVQLAYDELLSEDIDRLLGYAGIAQSNGPIGLPMKFQPFVVHNHWLLYPLDGLEDHLRRSAPDIAAAIDEAGSMDALVAAKDDLSALEYLVGGILACIVFCKENSWGLMITW